MLGNMEAETCLNGRFSLGMRAEAHAYWGECMLYDRLPAYRYAGILIYDMDFVNLALGTYTKQGGVLL